jgi:hypothetical protein
VKQAVFCEVESVDLDLRILNNGRFSSDRGMELLIQKKPWMQVADTKQLNLFFDRITTAA